MYYSEAIKILEDTADWLKEKKGVKLPPIEKRIESLELAIKTFKIINSNPSLLGDDIMKVKEAVNILEGIINGKA